MIIRKVVEYVFDPSEVDSAAMFKVMADPFKWEADFGSSPSIAFRKTDTFYVDDPWEYFKKSWGFDKEEDDGRDQREELEKAHEEADPADHNAEQRGPDS